MPNQTPNTPPVVNAGADTTITIPKNTVILTATVSDHDGIGEYKWEKISGPSSLYMEQNGLTAKAVWPEEGVYEFEFTAIDKTGLSSKDTVAVTLSTQMRKYILNDVTPQSSMLTEFQLPEEVVENLKWVFCKSSDRCELADSGPLPNIDYAWGGWFFNVLPNNRIAVGGGYTNQSFDLIIYY
jgi:hypothetical protein